MQCLQKNHEAQIRGNWLHLRETIALGYNIFGLRFFTIHSPTKPWIRDETDCWNFEPGYFNKIRICWLITNFELERPFVQWFWIWIRLMLEWLILDVFFMPIDFYRKNMIWIQNCDWKFGINNYHSAMHA